MENSIFGVGVGIGIGIDPIHTIKPDACSICIKLFMRYRLTILPIPIPIPIPVLIQKAKCGCPVLYTNRYKEIKKY